MKRTVGLGNALQALAYGWVAYELGETWTPLLPLFGAASLAQGALALAILLGRASRNAVVWVSLASLLAVALLLGVYAQGAVHLSIHFGPLAGKQAMAMAKTVALWTPWLVGVPLVQLLSGDVAARAAGRAGAALALAALLPCAQAWLQGSASQRYEASDAQGVAAWVWDRAQGRTTSLPGGSGPVLWIVSTVAEGAVRDTTFVEADSPQEAAEALELPRLGPAGALVVEVAQASGPLWHPLLARDGFVFARPGASALRTPQGILPSFGLWKPGSVRSRELVPELGQPSLTLTGPRQRADRWVHVEAYLASHEGVTPLDRGWAAAPELSPDTLASTVSDAAYFLVRNMAPDGQFTYIVKGPTGEPGPGYNFPRHAGTTWFLARAASRTGDPELERAARLALSWMEARTERFADGTACVLDPKRRDEKAWVGTTSLALLAALELGERSPTVTAWTEWIVSAVDDKGQVRGNFDRESQTWPEAGRITYAQGQGLLALAVAHRDGVGGVDGLLEALERAAAFVEGPYASWPGGNLVSGDEHWMCLAALAADDALGYPAGLGVCQGYLTGNVGGFPVRNHPLQPPSGPAAGNAEAVVARAELARRAGDPESRWHHIAVAFADAFLRSQYRPADRVFVHSDALLGGFRDSPWDLDVQIDAVQHVGGALLGTEQLLRGEEVAGGMP